MPQTIILSWRHLGLRILPQGADRPVSIAIGAGLLFGIYMGLADALLFRSIIPASQSALIWRFSDIDRIAYFTPLVLLEELEFRLVLMSALVWILAATVGPRAWCFWAAILSTALLFYPLLHRSYLSALAPTALTVLRAIMLQGAAGTLWGYLYWRHGLVAAIGGHVGAHVSLEPLLTLLFV
jgi:hypothetical protein